MDAVLYPVKIVLMKGLFFVLFFSCCLLPAVLIGQSGMPMDPAIDSLVLTVGDQVFSTSKHSVVFQGKQQLAFSYASNEQVVRGELYLKPGTGVGCCLSESPDYDIIDDLEFIDQRFYSFRVRFKNLAETEFLRLRIEIVENGRLRNTEIPLFPHTDTELAFYPGSEDLYLGEARKFELVTNHIDNLVLDGIWRETPNYDYRLVRNENKAYLFLEPKNLGAHDFELSVRTKRPALNADLEVSYELPPIVQGFNVKNSRHIFLRLEPREVIRIPGELKEHEVQIDNNRRLQMGKTYRLEASEELGSPLVAELFTERRLTNDRVMCRLRTYADHRVSDGFLFIKDGDNPVFMTNIDIVPQPEIAKASLLKKGGNWSSELRVKPGEIIDLRLEGKSLRKAQFFFEELEVLASDSVTQSDAVRNYKLRVPVNITRRQVEVLNGDKSTGVVLQVVEHNKPRSFDFVMLNYGEGLVAVNEINQPILYPKTVNEVVISFDRDKIDAGEVLHGVQHIEITARIEDKGGRLIEARQLGHFAVCPGEKSPRAEFYPSGKCRVDDLFLNAYLSQKTHSLADWSRIELSFEHVDGNYSTEGFSKKVVIYNQKRITFDVDVSIPAGLITQRIGQGETLSPLLTGIGFAMVAQFSFYKKGEIQRMLPIKSGVGFLAQNAFNFNPDADRDLGLIAITSVYPIKSTSKFSFPLFGGFGYFMQEQSFFFMIGPGIRVSF